MRVNIMDGKPVMRFEYVRFTIGSASLDGRSKAVPCVCYESPGESGCLWDTEAVEKLEQGELSDTLLRKAREIEALWERNATALKEWNDGHTA